MAKKPPQWSTDQLTYDAAFSIAQFRNERLEVSDAWTTYWLDQFGALQVVPAAVLSGVFNVVNLEQAQQRRLALFWSHALEHLGAFIESTGGDVPARRLVLG